MTLMTDIARFDAEARVEHGRLIKRLRSTASPANTAIAELLEHCRPKAPCRDGACPTCGCDLQQAATELVRTQIRPRALEIRGRMNSGTWVPSIGCIAPDELTFEACLRVRNEVAEALLQLSIPPCVATVEIAFCEDDEGEIPPHWSIHVHWIGVHWLTESQTAAVKSYFPRHPLIKKPFVSLPLDRKKAGRLYPFKPLHVRKVSYIEPASEDGSRGAYRSNHRRPLRPHQSVAAALVEHQLGYGGKLIGHGIDEGAIAAVVDGLKRPRDSP